MNVKYLLMNDVPPWENSLSFPLGRAGWLIVSLFLFPSLLFAAGIRDFLVPLLATSAALPACIAPGKALGMKRISGRDIRFVFFAYLVWLVVSITATWGWKTFLSTFDIAYSPRQDFAELVECNHNWMVRVSLFWAVCINTPIVEEVLFRRIIYSGLYRIHPAGAALGTSVLFSLVHFFLFGIPSLFLMGIFFQYTFLSRRNLWCAIFFHALINTVSFLTILYKEFI